MTLSFIDHTNDVYFLFFFLSCDRRRFTMCTAAARVTAIWKMPQLLFYNRFVLNVFPRSIFETTLNVFFFFITKKIVSTDFFVCTIQKIKIVINILKENKRFFLMLCLSFSILIDRWRYVQCTYHMYLNCKVAECRINSHTSLL